MPDVSVVIPVYNGARYLDEALESVFAQTFNDYEVICVDDGSTDSSSAVLRRYGHRLAVISQANTGQGGARNTGVRHATGTYVAFLDQDDRWYPHKLQLQVEVLQAEPDAVLAHCNSDRMDREGRLLQVGATLAERDSAAASPLGRMLGEGLILPSAMLVRRHIFERAGGFDPELRGFEDFDLCARLRQYGRFVFLEEPGMCYRVHLDGFSQRGGGEVIRSRERFLIRMRDLYAGDREKTAFIDGMLADCYSDWGKQEVRAGHYRQGRSMLLRSLRHDPWKLRTYGRLLRAALPRVSSSQLSTGVRRTR